jgi:hypothetical protein
MGSETGLTWDLGRSWRAGWIFDFPPLAVKEGFSDGLGGDILAGSREVLKVVCYSIKVSGIDFD